MINNKEELELMEASKNYDLEKVKNLVETNRFDNNTLEKAESVTQNISCSKVADYLQDIMGKNSDKKIIEKFRRALNSRDSNDGMKFGKSNFKMGSNPPDDNDINKQI